jgi:(2Fe-2S) ferredoxin
VGNEPLRPRKRRIVLCMGPNCNRGGKAEPFSERLRQVLGEIVPAWSSSKPIRWEIANCLDMCDDGPNLIVHPDRTVYHHLDRETLDRILQGLLSEGETGIIV